MVKDKTYNELMEKHFKVLAQYVPVVSRVHGEHHPEFFEVKSLFDTIYAKCQEVENPDLAEEFTKLRDITNNYTVPSDVCETYAAVYKMLKEMDETYSKF